MFSCDFMPQRYEKIRCPRPVPTAIRRKIRTRPKGEKGRGRCKKMKGKMEEEEVEDAER